MTDFLAMIVAAIVEGILRVFTSQFVVKAILACVTYVFLFTIIPLLIQYLVPQQIMNAMDTYKQMLTGGMDSVACSGSTAPVAGGPTISCSAVVAMSQWGQGVAYLLDWFQFTAALQCFLPAMAVTFLFKRI